MIMALLPILANAATGNSYLKFADITAQPGDEVTLTIEMDNEDRVRAVGGCIELPDGVSIIPYETGYNQYGDKYYHLKANPNRCGKDETASYNPTNNNKFLLWPSTISGNSGPLFYATLKIDSNMKDGIYDIVISYQDFSAIGDDGNYGFKSPDYTGKLIVGDPATNSISANDITTKANTSFIFPINLENDDEIKEAEFKVALPNGVSLESSAVTSRGNGHEIEYKLRAGKYNFEVYSEKGTAFSGTDGAFVELTLKADNTMAPGDYTIQVSDITLITTDNEEVAVDDFTTKLTIAEPNSTLTSTDITRKAGKSIVLPINLENDNEITDIEFKLTLPAEVALESASVTDRGADQEVSYKLRSGSYKFEVSSAAGLPFTGTEGAAVNITLKTEKTVAAGDYTIQVSDILLITKDGKEISVNDFSVTLSLTEWKEITIEDITDLIYEYLEQ